MARPEKTIIFLKLLFGWLFIKNLLLQSFFCFLHELLVQCMQTNEVHVQIVQTTKDIAKDRFTWSDTTMEISRILRDFPLWPLWQLYHSYPCCMLFYMTSFIADSILVITKLEKFNFLHNILPFLQVKKKYYQQKRIKTLN